MGTTAQKLTYLNETKSQLKNTINYGGASITNDTFRQYPRKLYTQYLDILKNPDTLFNGMPKVPEQTGTELTLNNTADTRMKLELKPSELTQETTTGKQLFNKEATVYDSGHCTYSYNNGVYTITNTDTSNFSISLNLNIPAGNYIFSSKTFLSNSTQLRNSQLSPQTQVNLGDSYSNQNITLNNSVDYIIFNFASSDQPITLDLNTLMIRPTGTTDTYEPYTGGIPQPNPSYPSDVQVIKGNNSIKIENKNLIKTVLPSVTSKDGLTLTQNSDGSFILNGISTGAGRFGITDFSGSAYFTLGDLGFIQGESGKLSGCPSGGNTSVPTTSYKIFMSGSNGASNVNDGGTGGTITANSANMGGKYYLAIDYASGVNFDNMVFKPMIEKGSTVTSYVPHQEQVLPLNLPSGIEYCKIGDYEDSFIKTSGKNKFNSNALINYRGDASETITADKIKITDTSLSAGSHYVNFQLLDMTGLEGKTVRLKAKWTTSGNNVGRITLRKGTTGTGGSTVGTAIGTLSTSENTISYTIPNDLGEEKILGASLYSNYGSSTWTSNCYINYENVIITIDNSDMTYEPYGTGDWWLKKASGKVVLDGTENYTDWGTSPNWNGAYIVNPVQYDASAGTDIRGISDYFPVIVGTGSTATNGCIGFRQSDNQKIWYFLLKYNFNNLAEFKTWLSTHNTTVYYVFSTPTHTEITYSTLISQLNAIEQAVSYDEQTNISQTNTGLPFRIKATAIKNIENVFN